MGVRCQVHKDGNEIKILTEEGTDVTKRLPRTIEEIRRLNVHQAIFDSELEAWEEGKHLPRETIAGYLMRKDEPDDSFCILNVFDCLYYNGKDLHNVPLRERIDYLERINFPQVTDAIPSLKWRLNRAPSRWANNKEEVRKITERLRWEEGSEGVVCKRHDSIYPLAVRTMDTWIKFHNNAVVYGIVVEQIETKVKGVYNYDYAIDFQDYDVRVNEKVDIRGEEYLLVGRTFSTDVDVPRANIIEVEFEQMNIIHNEDGTISVSFWAPRFIRHAKEMTKPDTINKVRKRAEDNKILVEKWPGEKELRKAVDGLYIVEPHARLIYEGQKRMIVKSRLLNIFDKEYILCGEFAYGLIQLEKPYEIDLKQFRELRNLHLIEDEERERWWGKKDTLYAYRIKQFKPYRVPLRYVYPRGVQITIRNVELLEQEEFEKQQDPYMILPDEKEKLRYGMQVHFRGRSAHFDLRIEGPKKEYLVGWTIDAQIAGKIKEPVMTFKEGKEIVAESGKYFKIDLQTGRWKQRLKPRTREPVNVELLCQTKAVEPVEWLEYEGITEMPEEDEPVPVGATRFFPGVFVMADRGRVEWLAQKTYFHEYWFHGKALNGRYLFRKLRPEEFGKEKEEEEIIAPAKIEPKRPFEWFFINPVEQIPYVLTDRARELEWIPPLGYSALPEFIRLQIPTELQYWKAKSEEEALKIRDELIESIKREEIIKLPEPKESSIKQLKRKFSYQYQWWRGPIIIRFGATRRRWTIRILMEKDKIMQFEFDKDLLKVKQADSFMSMVKDGEILLFQGEAKPRTWLNPDKETPSFVELWDTGDCLILEDKPDFKKIEFRGKKLKNLYTFKHHDGMWLVERSELPELKKYEDFEKKFDLYYNVNY